jgi:quercetin dioxygenase-like cupin family protein
MKSLRHVLLAVLFASICATATVAAEQGAEPAAPGPVVINKAAFPVTVASGDYELLNIVQDFPPGTGVGNHKHGGHVLVIVLSGEITLREKGGERVVKAGESWTEQPGAVHSVVNAGKETVRVVASFLLPKGAEVTTLIK